MSINDQTVQVSFVEKDFRVSDLDNISWMSAQAVRIHQYWSGAAAPAVRHCAARMLWSAEALYVKFESVQSEPLVTSEHPDITQKSIGLWDRDVCELFIAPDPATPDKYFEFEVAPTGEWVDLAIEFRSGERICDPDYSSGMTAAARVEKNSVVSAIKIPWAAFGVAPKTGDLWRGNLFRCVGQDPARGYLAWQPTLTDVPNFHVPERFGSFEFVS
jgi:alpha-galactosidase